MRRACAFTLIEVMLAIAIMIALSGSMFGFLWNTLERRDRLQGIAQDSQAATAVLERIETDVFGAITGDAKGAAGVSGQKTRLKVLTRGVNLPRQEGVDAKALGDLQGAEYMFDEGSGELRARRWGGQDGAGASSFEVVSDRVERVQFRFFNGRRWTYRFDSSQSNNLPVAIEVAIWFKTAEMIEEEEEEARRLALLEAMDGDLTEQMLAEEFEEEGAFEDDLPEIEMIREPDRLRVILVPDGPLAAWRESA